VSEEPEAVAHERVGPAPRLSLGAYEALERLGAGGMGVVYRAHHRVLAREAAVKVLSPLVAHDPAFLERFRREAQALARLAHPGIVQVYDVGEDGGCHYIAMELVSGRTLAQDLSRRSLPIASAVSIAAQVADALGAAHSAGLVHRDVKPSNILVDVAERVKIADFGLVRSLDATRAERLTESNAIVGTPHYASPEQARGRAELTPASDVYSLGVVLFEMLAGAHPFGEVSPSEALLKHLNEGLPPIRRFRPDIPDVLEHILTKCLRRDPEERYAAGAALHHELNRLRLSLGMRQLDSLSGPSSAPSAHDTSLYYIDATRSGGAPSGMTLRLFREALAQCTDPNRWKRRHLNRLFSRMGAPRQRCRDLERQREALRVRCEQHKRRAKGAADESARLIEQGPGGALQEAIDQERRHGRLVADYEAQLKQLDWALERPRRELQRLRREYSRKEDELFLLDAEARRKGRLIPSWQVDRELARRGRMVLIGIVVMLVALAVSEQYWLAVLYLVFVYVMMRFASSGTEEER